MGKKHIDKIITRAIFEIRFNGGLSIIDTRGSLLNALSQNFDYNSYKLEGGRVEVVDDPKKTRNILVVTTNNAGCDFELIGDKDEAITKVKKFLTVLKEFENFEPTELIRVGFKWQFYIHQKSTSFTNIFNGVKGLLNIDPTKFGIHEKMVDVGLPLHFEGDSYKINTQIGAMDKEQARATYFTRNVYENQLPNTGLYFDADTFKTYDPAEDFDWNMVAEKSIEVAEIGYSKFESFPMKLIETL